MIDRTLRALTRLFYPRRARCLGCGAISGCREDWVCPDCRAAMMRGWIGAGLPPRGIDAAAFAFVYRKAAATLVWRLKYDDLRGLAEGMGADMARACRAIEPTGADCVACVPMHPARRHRRGYNHAELLAREVAARLGLPYLDALERVINTPQQAKADARTRYVNLRDAFRARPEARGRRVLLVDDVCTTGATATACAEALRRGGAQRVCLLCYARTVERQFDEGNDQTSR